MDSTKYVVQSVILYETSGYAKSFNQIHQSLSQKSAYANFQGTFQPSYNFENVSFGFDTNSTRSTFSANFTSSSGVNPFNSNSGPAQAFKILAGGIHKFNQLQEQNRQINTVGLLIKGIKKGYDVVSYLGAGVFGVKAVIDTKKALKNKGADFKGTPDDPDDEDGEEKYVSNGGTQFSSRTLWNNKDNPKIRIDVENPAPNKRPGQIHYQDDKGNKYLFDIDKNTFRGAPNKVNDMIKDNPEVKKAIEKGLKYLN